MAIGAICGRLIGVGMEQLALYVYFNIITSIRTLVGSVEYVVY